MKAWRTSILVLGCLLPYSCKQRTSSDNVSDAQSTNQNQATAVEEGIDANLGEAIQPGEEAATQEIVNSIKASIHPVGGDKLHPPGALARRDAHPKAHGCVEADFEVLPHSDASLKKGLFSAAKTYKAIIRFSNGNGDPTRHDIKGDGRGMAIKVKGVQGQRLMGADDGNADTQDFVMINHPVFFVSKPTSYMPIVKAVADGSISNAAKAGATVVWEPLDAKIIFDLSTIQIVNPLHEQYWSEVPYRLGEKNDSPSAIKFSAIPMPCDGSGHIPSILEKKAKLLALNAESLNPLSPLSPNYLREAMVESLKSGGSACFDFAVQVRVKNEKSEESVEDPRYEWGGDFERVARIKISSQNFNTPEKDLQCEYLSYSPWNGTTAHKPLGSVNRIRRAVYKTISETRHGQNPELPR